MNIEEMLDSDRWLMNNGLFSDSAKNNLYVYGFLVNKGVVGVEVSIDASTKTVSYLLYLQEKVVDAISKSHTLKERGSLWSLFLLRRLLKKHGNLNLKPLLEGFVKDYCGPQWNVTMEIRKESEFKDEEGPS